MFGGYRYWTFTALGMNGKPLKDSSSRAGAASEVVELFESMITSRSSTFESEYELRVAIDELASSMSTQNAGFRYLVLPSFVTNLPSPFSELVPSDVGSS